MGRRAPQRGLSLPRPPPPPHRRRDRRHPAPTSADAPPRLGFGLWPALAGSGFAPAGSQMGFRHSGWLAWPPPSPSFAWRNCCLTPPRLRLLGESPASLRGFLAARRSDSGAFAQAFFNALESHNIKEGNLGLCHRLHSLDQVGVNVVNRPGPEPAGMFLPHRGRAGVPSPKQAATVSETPRRERPGVWSTTLLFHRI